MRKLGKSLFRLYRSAPLMERLHIVVRYITCPFLEIEARTPREGRILEIGCGHGLFCHLLALSSGKRDVTGIDISPKKIEAARSSIGDGEHMRFMHMDFFKLAERDFSTVALVDVLYLMPYDQQERMLRRIFELLPEGGTLVLKTMDKQPRWKYAVCVLQETLAVKVFRITAGQGIYIRSSSDFRALLEGIGFRVEHVPLDKWYLHTHCVFVCRKEGEGQPPQNSGGRSEAGEATG